MYTWKQLWIMYIKRLNNHNKYNLKLGQTNYISIDLRDAKYSSKTKTG